VAADSIAEALRTLVRGTTAVTDYIGTGSSARLYWLAAPDDLPTMPYIVYSIIADPAESRGIGQKHAQPRVQFSVFADHKENGYQLAEALLEALNHYYGTSDDLAIDYIRCTGPTALKDPNYDNVYQFVVDAEVRYERV